MSGLIQKCAFGGDCVGIAREEVGFEARRTELDMNTSEFFRGSVNLIDIRQIIDDSDEESLEIRGIVIFLSLAQRFDPSFEICISFKCPPTDSLSKIVFRVINASFDDGSLID